jgi:hypothetical protein
LLDLFARSSARTRRERFHHALLVFPQRYLDEILDAGNWPGSARRLRSTRRYAMALGSLLFRHLGHPCRLWHRDRVGIVEPGNFAVRKMIARVARAVTRYEDGLLVINIPVPRQSAAQVGYGVKFQCHQRPVTVGFGAAADRCRQ